MGTRRWHGRLERELAESRPRPSDEYVAATVALFEPETGPGATSPARTRRIVALAITAALVGGFAALGGLSQARLSASGVASSSAGAVQRAFDLSDASSAPRSLLAVTCVYTDGSADTFAFNTVGPQHVNTPFSVTITALGCAYPSTPSTVTSYDGDKTLTWGGTPCAPNCPTGSPVYPANPVHFTNGVATVSITLNTAESPRLGVSDGGPVSGASNTFTVSP
jgi:hypothetical protein